MTTAALLTMIITQSLVTGFTIYFFVKVLRVPPKAQPDSFEEEEENTL